MPYRPSHFSGDMGPKTRNLPFIYCYCESQFLVIVHVGFGYRGTRKMIVGTSKRFATRIKGFNPAPSVLGLPCLPDQKRSTRPASVPQNLSLGRHPAFLSVSCPSTALGVFLIHNPRPLFDGSLFSF